MVKNGPFRTCFFDRTAKSNRPWARVKKLIVFRPLLFFFFFFFFPPSHLPSHHHDARFHHAPIPRIQTKNVSILFVH